jgi:hypothetical protein
MVNMVLPTNWLKTAEQLCTVLHKEAALYGADPQPAILLKDAVFCEIIDRASDLPGYEGTWRNPQGSRCGSLIINSDGSYYAEYDVLALHPGKPNWFVEAVTVWGRDGVVKTEPRLLAAV